MPPGAGAPSGSAGDTTEDAARKPHRPAPAGPVRLRLPAPVARPEKPPLPLAAAIGPLIAAGAIWALTRSPYALIFAALSPVMAVAGLVDALWHGRRSLRRQRAARVAALARLRDEVRAAKDHERERRRRAAPSPSAILARPAVDPGRWRRAAGAGHGVEVTIGVGPAVGDIEVEGEAQDDDERMLCADSAAVPDAPVLVPAEGGVAVVGPPLLAWSAMRGILVQVAHAYSPAEASLTVAGVGPADGAGPALLPHAAARDRPAAVAVELRGPDALAAREAPGRGDADGAEAGPRRIRLLVGDDLARIPPSVETILRVAEPGRAEIVHAPAGVVATRVRCENVGRHDFGLFAARLRAHAAAVGAVVSGGLPDRVQLVGLLAARPGAGERGSLACVIGADAEGPRGIDLVADGPHAVIGGTTGSGKSEFLISWITSMAAGRSPEDVVFLLVDFKGGAAFAPLTRLPHCVGVITDLDAAAAARAVSSLRAELLRRERTLADAGVADIADAAMAGALPRLVIVVDEFQAMLEALPDLHGVFADIAARGRSLGVHLILCTQRPAGVVRDAVMANCGLRVCLRVHARSDSQAVIGDARAASLPADRPGRCLVGPVGAASAVQAAVADAAVIDEVAHAAAASPAPRRPWLDPLPRELRVADLSRIERAAGGAGPAHPTGGIPIGLADRPDRQEQGVVRYAPHADGHLLAVGAAGSGRTTLLRGIAAAADPAGARVLRGAEECWDAVQHAAAVCSGEIEAPSPAHGSADRRHGTLLLLDDVDALLARLDDDYAPAFADALAVVLREGAAHGLHVVATAQRLGGALGSLAPLFGGRMLLRIPDRREFVFADGDPALFDPDLPPGGAVWRGERIQLALPDPPREPRASSPVGSAQPASAVDLVAVDLGRDGAIIVTRRPAALARRLRARHEAAVDVVVIDPAQPGSVPEHPGGPAQPGGDPAQPGSVPEHPGGGPGVADAATGDPATGAPGAAAGDGLRVAAAPRPVVLIGDPESWQQAWSLLASRRDRVPLLFDSCAPVDVRLLTRIRTLPPLVERHREHLWLATVDGELRRAVLG